LVSRWKSSLWTFRGIFLLLSKSLKYRMWTTWVLRESSCWILSPNEPWKGWLSIPPAFPVSLILWFREKSYRISPQRLLWTWAILLRFFPVILLSWFNQRWCNSWRSKWTHGLELDDRKCWEGVEFFLLTASLVATIDVFTVRFSTAPFERSYLWLTIWSWYIDTGDPYLSGCRRQ